MTLPHKNIRTVAGVVATVVAIAASALIWHNLPTTTDIYAPFDVAGGPGAVVTGRNLEATVTGVRIASQVHADSVLTRTPVAAIGKWVAVDTTQVSLTDPVLPHAELIAGANTYRATDRLPFGTTLGGLLQPGISTSGSWVFDVPQSLLGPRDTVYLRLWNGDGRLDTVLKIALPLDDSRVVRTDTADLVRPKGSAA